MQEDPLINNPNNLIVNHEDTSHRHASKCGMQMIQSLFPILKGRFMYEEHCEKKGDDENVITVI